MLELMIVKCVYNGSLYRISRVLVLLVAEGFLDSLTICVTIVIRIQEQSQGNRVTKATVCP